MEDKAVIYELMNLIKDDIIQYKNIKKNIYNDDRKDIPITETKILRNIIVKIRCFIDEINNLDDDFRPIGIYNNNDLSCYYINPTGIIINGKGIIKAYNNTYFLKPLNQKRTQKFSKKSLVNYIFAE